MQLSRFGETLVDCKFPRVLALLIQSYLMPEREKNKAFRQANAWGPVWIVFQNGYSFNNGLKIVRIAKVPSYENVGSDYKNWKLTRKLETTGWVWGWIPPSNGEILAKMWSRNFGSM